MTTQVDISEKAIEYAITTLNLCAQANWVAGNDATSDELKKHAKLIRALRSALTAEAEHRKRLEAELAEARRG